MTKTTATVGKAERLAALKKAIADAGGLKTLRVGEKMFIFTPLEEAKVMKQARAYAIRSGHSIKRDGTIEFYEWIERWGARPGDYVWAPEGNRVKADLFRRFFDAKGVETRTLVRSAWRPLE